MTEKEIQELVRDFNDRKEFIVPVIGEELLCYDEDTSDDEQFATDGCIPLQQYVIDTLIPDTSDSNANLKKRMNEADWYYCLTLLGKSKGPIFDNEFSKILRSPKVKLCKEAGGFLEQNEFPLILTTLTTDIIERSISKIQYRSEWYNINWNPNESCELKQPTVFHLMGNSNSWCFVKNENDLVEFLDKLLSTERSPVNMFTHLNNKALMMLGCELPDWVFRLLLYRMDRNGFDGKKQGFWLVETGADVELNDVGRVTSFSKGMFRKEMSLSQLDFLDKISFQHMPDLKKVLSVLTPKGEPDTSKHGYDYDIFLSYAGKDVKFKNAVARLLIEQYHLKIWAAPERTQQGGDYWINIQNGIRQSRYFMPLVSTEYIAKFLSSDRGYGKWLREETEEAVEELERRNKVLASEGKPPVTIYSLPVIDLNGTYYDDSRRLLPIDNAMLEELAEGGSPLLPPTLFFRKHMYEFGNEDNNCTFFNNNWSRYKGEIE